MHIQVAIRHESINGGIHEFVKLELAKIEAKYSPLSADVVLDHEAGGKVKIAEITLKVKGDIIVVREVSDDIRKSLDMAVKTLEHRLQRHKETHVKTGPLRRHTAEPKGII